MKTAEPKARRNAKKSFKWKFPATPRKGLPLG